MSYGLHLPGHRSPVTAGIAAEERSTGEAANPLNLKGETLNLKPETRNWKLETLVVILPRLPFIHYHRPSPLDIRRS
jgi:hypothetical protein